MFPADIARLKLVLSNSYFTSSLESILQHDGTIGLEAFFTQFRSFALTYPAITSSQKWLDPFIVSIKILYHSGNVMMKDAIREFLGSICDFLPGTGSLAEKNKELLHGNLTK